MKLKKSKSQFKILDPVSNNYNTNIIYLDRHLFKNKNNKNNFNPKTSQSLKSLLTLSLPLTSINLQNKKPHKESNQKNQTMNKKKSSNKFILKSIQRSLSFDSFNSKIFNFTKNKFVKNNSNYKYSIDELNKNYDYKNFIDSPSIKYKKYRILKKDREHALNFKENCILRGLALNDDQNNYYQDCLRKKNIDLVGMKIYDDAKRNKNINFISEIINKEEKNNEDNNTRKKPIKALKKNNINTKFIMNYSLKDLINNKLPIKVLITGSKKIK